MATKYSQYVVVSKQVAPPASAIVVIDHSDEGLPYFDGFNLEKLLAYLPVQAWESARTNLTEEQIETLYQFQTAGGRDPE